MSEQPSSQTTTTFDHVFSGYSVWLEPEATTDCGETSEAVLLETMAKLAKQCGGPKNGVYPFLPHCTMLYNINPRHLFNDKQSKNRVEEEKEYDFENEERQFSDAGVVDMEAKKICVDLIERCVQEYRSSCISHTLERSIKIVALEGSQHEEIRATSIPTIPENVSKNEELRPITTSKSTTMKVKQERVSNILYLQSESVIYFPYPKHADNGKGFGCLILLLKLNRTEQLANLHAIVSKVFPRDERHGEASGNFIPHMAMVYAPESEVWLEEVKKTMQAKKHEPPYVSLVKPIRAKYLSVWSTQGRISEWYRICKIELP